VNGRDEILSRGFYAGDGAETKVLANVMLNSVQPDIAKRGALVRRLAEAQSIKYATHLSTAAAILLLLLPLMIPACGGSSSSPTAVSTPSPTLRANVGITSITVSGEMRAVGQAYRVTVHLHETAGTAATIVAVDLTFTSGATTTLSAHFDQPISETANVCPANGSVDSRELMVVDADASHAYATTAQAKVTFTDSSTAVGTTTSAAGVPALSPPPPQTFTLTGVITDTTTHAGIVGASLNVLTGPNTGKSAVTDSTGTYTMGGLVADSFRLRASANDYDSGEQGVTVPAIPRADFILGKSCGYTLSSSSGIAIPGLTGGAAFSVTPTTANNCPWTVSTPDAWILLRGATTGSGSGDILYSAINGSGATRTGHIIVGWSSGTAIFTITQPAASCPPPISLAIPASGGGQSFVDIGAGCYYSTTAAIDVPWIHFFGTMGGGRFYEMDIDSNPGAPRTGNITFSGDGLYLQVTLTQAGRTSITAGDVLYVHK
jgi:hypothetical protein